MSATIWDIVLYAGALFALFLTPGPVWLALMARTVAGGFPAAWPLALGVAVGDILWPFVAIMGLAWIANEVEGAMSVMRWVACAVFVWMGVGTIRRAGAQISMREGLTKAGFWAGFVAGVVTILGNPKAIIFYMGVLPGFFDLEGLQAWDIVLIVLLSALVPFVCNLGFIGLIAQIRRYLNSPRALRRMNVISGTLLIVVGLVLPFT